MSTQPESAPRSLARSITTGTSLLCMIAGGLVLGGWIFDIQFLKSLSPNWVTMKANTAVGFILAGLSLWLLREEQGTSRDRLLGQACAAVVTLLGLLTLGEYVFQTDLGIDQLLFKEVLSAVETSHPGRMSPATAASFILIGLALLGLNWTTRRGRHPAQALCLPVAFAGLMAFTGYLYGVKSLYGFLPFSSMAVHTALLSIVLSLGVLCARPDEGPLSILTSQGVGGSLARRLLPFAVFVPVFLGWLRLKGQEAGFYSFEMGLALFATSNVIIFSILIWLTAVSLNLAEAERKQADATLHEAEREKLLALEANRMKSEFLANMSHELRTPLNGIIGFGEVLLAGKPGPLNPRQREFLGDVLDNGRHLLQLINDVLDLSKVEAGKMELFPGPFSLRQAIEEACSVVVVQAQKKNITVNRTVDPAVDAVTLDPQKVKQVLFNLLSNAVKFTNEGGQVDVRVTPHDAAHLRLQVQDTGIGIRAEDLGRLFLEFQQLDSGITRQHQGTGLGLALTRRLVELQQGSISVESELGKGSTFTVVLPRQIGMEKEAAK